MRPIDQTVFGAPMGNCLPACVASLLHLELVQVPHFGADGWLDALRAWLAPRGFWPAYCELTPDGWRPEGLYILAGKSPRGSYLHAVVAEGSRIVHDPHPSRAGLLSYADATILVPFDPYAVCLQV
jgi:hypothetical protein